MGKRETALQVIAQVAGKDASTIEPGMDLVADLGIDSAKSLQLLVGLEDAMDVEISDDEAAKMETVGDVLEFLTGAA